MANDAEKVNKLLRQQAALAKFGSFALRQENLLKVLTEAARVCAEGLAVPFSKVCRYRIVEGDLLVEAGYGWKQGVIGNVVSRADSSTPQGRSFITGEPSICNDLRNDNKFTLPSFYADHGIISTIDVVIKGGDRPYGVLEIDNNKQHDYDQHDIDFLTGFANVLAEAVATSARSKIMQSTLKQMTLLLQEKDQLLDQKKILAEELQHRVRNNLQLIYGMLSKQLADTADEVGQRGIKSIARRVSTLSQVYDHLLGNEMSQVVDFGGFAKSLCNNLADFQTTHDGTISLTCDSEEMPLDLNTVTALGLVIAELVTNSYEHAFPRGHGSVIVSVRRALEDVDVGVLTIRDDGTGFSVEADSKRHGLVLIRRLAEQVRATLTVASDSGTVWIIRFPARRSAGV